MKYLCNLIRDILPLYHDSICSEESRCAIEEHLEECRECRQYYDKMCDSDIVEAFAYDDELEKKKAESLKGVKKKLKKKQTMSTIKVIILGIVGVVLMHVVIGCAMLAFMWFGYESAKVEEYTNIAEYEKYIGENAEERFNSKWGMDESIFPEKITDDMQIQDYIMVYYNPFDAMYLSHLVVEYDEVAYQAEVERLTDYESTEYLGYYTVTGFDEDYTLLAIYADDYQGFVYALTDNVDTVVYVELIFCNYFMDLDYESYIPTEHLPVGFDAKNGNAYQQMMTEK